MGTRLSRVLKLETELACWSIQTTRDKSGQRRLKIRCDCGKEDNWFNSTLDEATEAVTHFTKKGWLFKRKNPTFCSPECMKAAKLEKEIVVQKPTLPPPPKPQTTTAIPVAPIPAIGSDIRLTLRVGAMIEDHFNRDIRRFHDNWSDERVAKESGASLDFAIRVRKEAFGELAQDPAISKLHEDVVAIKDLLDQENKRHSEWRSAMEAQIKELDYKLQRLGLQKT